MTNINTAAQKLGNQSSRHNEVIDAEMKQALAFVILLTGSANTAVDLRTFDDDAERSARQFARKFNGQLKPLIAELRHMNAQGAGVFMVINQGGQTKDEINKIRAVFADTDGAPLEPLLCLKPHLIVQSSPGKWHVYWLIDENFPLEMFKPIQLAIAGKYGTDPAVNDLPRVMRLPGFNHCKKDPFPVRITQHDKDLPRYSLEEILDGLELDLPEKAAPQILPPEWLKSAVGGNLSVHAPEFPKAFAEIAVKHCKQLEKFSQTGGSNEPIWYNTLGLLKHFEDGDSYAHEWSAKHPSYSHEETQAKLDQWAYGPTTCEKFKDINPDDCMGCMHTCKSPIQLGVTAPPPAWLDVMNSQYAWIEKDAGIYRRQHRDFIAPDKFHNAYANQTRTVQTQNGPRAVSISRLWLRNQNRSQYRQIVTRPGEPEVTADGSLNDWAGFTVEPIGGDVQPFKNLYRHLFGNERFPLLWLAHLIQRPGIKMFVALVVWSPEEGVGKNILFEAVGALFDQRHYKLIGQSEVDDDFCGWIPGAVFVIADEVRASKSDKSRDRLKLWQTATRLRTHDKNQPKREVENLMNMVFLSNHADGMFLSDHDRRFFVHEVKASPVPEAIKQEYLVWRDNGGLAFLRHYLENINLEGFDPKGRAPMTESKREMIEASRSDLERWALDIVSGNTPLGREIVTAEEMSRRFQTEYPNQRPPSVATVGKVLIRMGAHRRDNQIRLKDSRKVRGLAIQRPDHWKAQPESAWRDELEKRL